MNAFGWIKDPGSALTHFIGLLMAAAGAWPLLGKTAGRQDKAAMVCMLVFILSMVFLYTASTVYHTFDLGEK